MSEHHESLNKLPVKKPSEFSFGMTFSIIFLILAVYSFLNHKSTAPLWVGLSALFGLVTFTKPSLLSPLNHVWHQFGLLLNKVTQPIILFILFYLFLTPIAFLFRRFSQSDLRLQFDPTSNSYWIKKEAYDSLKESMKNQF